MSYAFVQAIAAAALVEPAQAGLILSRRRPTDAGVRIIANCEREPTPQRFRTERLEPALACLAATHGRKPPSASSRRSAPFAWNRCV